MDPSKSSLESNSEEEILTSGKDLRPLCMTNTSCSLSSSARVVVSSLWNWTQSMLEHSWESSGAAMVAILVLGHHALIWGKCQRLTCWLQDPPYLQETHLWDWMNCPRLSAWIRIQRMCNRPKSPVCQHWVWAVMGQQNKFIIVGGLQAEKVK